MPAGSSFTATRPSRRTAPVSGRPGLGSTPAGCRPVPAGLRGGKTVSRSRAFGAFGAPNARPLMARRTQAKIRRHGMPGAPGGLARLGHERARRVPPRATLLRPTGCEGRASRRPRRSRPIRCVGSANGALVTGAAGAPAVPRPRLTLDRWRRLQAAPVWNKMGTTARRGDSPIGQRHATSEFRSHAVLLREALGDAPVAALLPLAEHGLRGRGGTPAVGRGAGQHPARVEALALRRPPDRPRHDPGRLRDEPVRPVARGEDRRDPAGADRRRARDYRHRSRS